MCLYFLTNKWTPGGVGRVWSAVSRPLKKSLKYTSSMLFYTWALENCGHLFDFLTVISVNSLFSFLVALFLFLWGWGVKFFMTTPFFLIFGFTLNVTRIDRIICTHHFADAKKKKNCEHWVHFWGYLLLFNQWRKTDMSNHNNTSTAKWAFAITVSSIPLGSPVCTDINQLFVALFIHNFII